MESLILDIISETVFPLSIPSSLTRKETISTLPFTNVSTFMAMGKRRTLAISAAASCSGFMTMSSPISFLSVTRSAEYSGSLTLAMVCFAPSLFAVRQQSIFISSDWVVAIIRSASSTPAEISTLVLRQLPFMHIISSLSLMCCSFSKFLSMSTMSCSSPVRCFAMACPTFPPPAMMIFINISLSKSIIA